MNQFKIDSLYFHNIGPVNITLCKSESIGVTGPSGAGKTLFLRAMADMDDHSGNLFLDGKESREFQPYIWRQEVGLLPSESSWWFDTVGEHFNNINKTWLEMTGFDQAVLKWNVSRLSSGERQRLALLRLLSNKPKVLLLDEPTANLDIKNALKVEKILTTYIVETESSMIWAGHDIEQLKRISGRQFIIKGGMLQLMSKASIF
ncbi:MAG: ATP-binding cassette domain-containing protein [Desulfosarcina sp.]|nr:ATP-binding cassette domain-containing protein [Desulfobacterales bacterium]